MTSCSHTNCSVFSRAYYFSLITRIIIPYRKRFIYVLPMIDFLNIKLVMLKSPSDDFNKPQSNRLRWRKKRTQKIANLANNNAVVRFNSQLKNINVHVFVFIGIFVIGLNINYSIMIIERSELSLWANWTALWSIVTQLWHWLSQTSLSLNRFWNAGQAEKSQHRNKQN